MEFLGFLTKKIKTPRTIDSTDTAVMEASLKLCPGRSVVNSINLKTGKIVLRVWRVCYVTTVPRWWCIDEDKVQGMAVTQDRKLSIAQRAFALLTEKHGLSPEDIIFDPLVFPAATGDKNYIGSARETIEGVRLIKTAFPRCKTILGISNISFGLPELGREVLNAVFLHECVQAGLDFAIVNAEKSADATISSKRRWPNLFCLPRRNNPAPLLRYLPLIFEGNEPSSSSFAWALPRNALPKMLSTAPRRSVVRSRRAFGGRGPDGPPGDCEWPAHERDGPSGTASLRKTK